MSPEIADVGSERADLRSGRTNPRYERADFRPERESFRSERADIRPERENFRSERADTGKTAPTRTKENDIFSLLKLTDLI